MKRFIYIPLKILLVMPLFNYAASNITLLNKQTIIELSSGYIVARAIHVAASLKVADYLADGPHTIDALALCTQTDPDALYRLLRLLASYDIFKENENKTFSLTPLARYLISHEPDSLWAWITYHHDSNRWAAYSNMEQSVHTGTPAFDHIFKKGFFDYIAENALLAEQFDEGMKNISADENPQIVSSYNFAPHAIITDIGGGAGGLLTEIVKNSPSSAGILFDLPHVYDSAKLYLAHHGMNSAITFVPSTGFFDPIPQADLYILKRILHDWNDEQAVTILKNCNNAMHNNARLLIIDAIVAEENVRDIKKDIDIEMMVLFGGKERTLKEWATLLDGAKLEIVAVHNTPSLLSIIEVKKK